MKLVGDCETVNIYSRDDDGLFGGHVMIFRAEYECRLLRLVDQGGKRRRVCERLSRSSFLCFLVSDISGPCLSV